MIVNIKIATYLPRFAVGAISDVAANAVNSLMPAPTPANVMPPNFVSHSSHQKAKKNHTDENVHRVSRRTDNHSEHDERSTEYCDIAASNQIGK